MQKFRSRGFISQFQIDLEQIKLKNDKNLPSFRGISTDSSRKQIPKYTRDEKINIFSKKNSSKDLTKLLPENKNTALAFVCKFKIVRQLKKDVFTQNLNE